MKASQATPVAPAAGLAKATAGWVEAGAGLAAPGDGGAEGDERAGPAGPGGLGRLCAGRQEPAAF